MEMNNKLKLNKSKLESELSNQKQKAKEALLSEKNKQKDIMDSLNETDQQKVRTSRRLETQDQDIDKLKMLYRQISSEKSALHREKEILNEKLAKKNQKLALSRKELEETVQKYQKVMDENQQFGSVIS